MQLLCIVFQNYICMYVYYIWLAKLVALPKLIVTESIMHGLLALVDIKSF